MILHCYSKKCNTTTDHKLKVDTNEAICMTCHEPNDKLSEQIKKTMKDFGDVIRDMTVKKAFMFKCSKCGVNRGVRLVDEQALCNVCLQPLGLSPIIVEAVKQSGNFTVQEKEKKEAEQPQVKSTSKRKKA